LIFTKKSVGVEGGVDHTVEWGEAARDEVTESEIKTFIEQVSCCDGVSSHVSQQDEVAPMKASLTEW
jgi:hypothetical protein